MHPCRMEQIDSVKINPSLVIMREWFLLPSLHQELANNWQSCGLTVLLNRLEQKLQIKSVTYYSDSHTLPQTAFKMLKLC